MALSSPYSDPVNPLHLSNLWHLKLRQSSAQFPQSSAQFPVFLFSAFPSTSCANHKPSCPERQCPQTPSPSADCFFPHIPQSTASKGRVFLTPHCPSRLPKALQPLQGSWHHTVPCALAPPHCGSLRDSSPFFDDVNIWLTVSLWGEGLLGTE